MFIRIIGTMTVEGLMLLRTLTEKLLMPVSSKEVSSMFIRIIATIAVQGLVL